MTNIDVFDDFGETALIRAAAGDNVEALAALIAAGADLNLKDGLGCTALHVAIAYGEEEGALKLISAGANANTRCVDGYTPLHHAGRKGLLSSVQKLLAAGANPDARDGIGRTPARYFRQCWSNSSSVQVEEDVQSAILDALAERTAANALWRGRCTVVMLWSRHSQGQDLTRTASSRPIRCRDKPLRQLMLWVLERPGQGQAGVFRCCINSLTRCCRSKHLNVPPLLSDLVHCNSQ
ncbi:unnamed protein product [Chrysoparadoxa australica]